MPPGDAATLIHLTTGDRSQGSYWLHQSASRTASAFKLSEAVGARRPEAASLSRLWGTNLSPGPKVLAYGGVAAKVPPVGGRSALG
jgi:hypothetical protein